MSNDSTLTAVRESLAGDRATLRAAVDRVPAALRQQKPAPDRWSVAEVLEHLSIVEGRIVGLLEAMIPTAPQAETPSDPAASVLDRTRFRNRANRITAPDAIRPTGTVSAENAWAALEQSRAQLLQILETAQGRDLAQISRQHPALGTINGYQWIAAIGGHEERHAMQIVEIADQLGAQASS
jgi:hypothetical protein